MSLEQMLQEDGELALRDWGEPVVYCRVTSDWDVSEQQPVESVAETPLQALVSSLEASAHQATAGQAVSAQLQVLLRLRDLPDGAPRLTDRLIWQGSVLQVMTFTAAARPGWMAIQAVRLQEADG